MSLVNEKLYKTEGVDFVNIKEFLSEILNHYRQIFPTSLLPVLRPILKTI
jgi:hypothetical protein